MYWIYRGIHDLTSERSYAFFGLSFINLLPNWQKFNIPTDDLISGIVYPIINSVKFLFLGSIYCIPLYRLFGMISSSRPSPYSWKSDCFTLLYYVFLAKLILSEICLASMGNLNFHHENTWNNFKWFTFCYLLIISAFVKIAVLINTKTMFDIF